MKIDYTIEDRTSKDEGVCLDEIAIPNQSRVDGLRALVGFDVLLLPCNGKLPSIAWKQLTIDDMTPAYIKKVDAAKNIGVVLGNRSGGLCVIDFDVNGEDDKFLKLNPCLATTLRTRGSRGSSLWIRVNGTCPRSTKLKSNGREMGEWRADGNQSIIAGMHPKTYRPYRMLKKASPVEIAFKDIQWPQGVFRSESRLPTSTPVENVTEVTEVDQVDQVDQAADVAKVVRDFGAIDLGESSEDDIVKLCVPNSPRQSHARLFDLARGLKTLEREHGQFEDKDLKRLFNKWYRLSKSKLRLNQRAEYFEEFLQACDTALIALDEGGLLTAWQMAKRSQPPNEAFLFKSAAARKLVSLCHQLQQLAGEKEFFLGGRSAAKLLKLTPVHTARLLATLVTKQVLEIVEKGDFKTERASRYRYKKTNGIII